MHDIAGLLDVLEPFRYVCDPHSVAADYRRLFITDKRIMARSARASIDALYALGIAEPFSIDFGLLYPLIRSLKTGEIEFSYEREVLSWRSGTARGKLAIAEPKELGMLPRSPANEGITTSERLSDTLDLGSIACADSALESVGLHGMIILQDGSRAFCISSDNVSVACASMPVETGQLRPGVITVYPQDVQLLSALAAHEGGRLVFQDSAIYYSDPVMRAIVHPVTPIPHDLYSICTPHFGARQVARLPHDRVAAFVKRATALTENRQHCSVIVRAAENQITLEFTENKASSEEMYLLEGVHVPTATEVMVDAVKLGKALQNCDELLLDNMPNAVLAFRNTDHSFYYLLAGRS